VRDRVAREMVDHLVASKANVSTPGDELAKLRRRVLRGLGRRR
jgi:hypothetical protein